jgi:hypothetical protein
MKESGEFVILLQVMNNGFFIEELVISSLTLHGLEKANFQEPQLGVTISSLNP